MIEPSSINPGNSRLPQSFDIFQRVPETDNATSLPKKDRKSLKDVADFIRQDQWEKAMTQRIRVARNWVGVRSIMEGYHYFRVTDFGSWVPLGKRDGEIRAQTNLMYSKYRREHGRLIDNDITVQAVPRSAMSGSAIYKADRGEIVANSWLDEINMPDIWDEFVQQHLIYGQSHLRRYVDQVEQQVMLEPVPAPEMAPIPYYETSDLKLSGLMRGKMVNRQWVEDNVPEAINKIGKSKVGLSEKSMYITSDVGMWNRYEDSAMAIWFWFKRSKSLPKGLMGLMVEDEIFRYTYNNGVIPFEVSRYSKQPSRWYGVGLCETLIAPQKEHNRQYTEVLKSARFNKGRLFVDNETFQINDLGNSDQQVIPMSDAAYIGDKVPYYYLPPQGTGRDVAVVMNLADDDARKAAGHESDIIMGQQEGRTESGPATERLHTNASAPLISCTRRMFNALKRSFPPCLDMLGQVWPDNKVLSTVGYENLPNEMLFKRDSMPTSQDVILKPGPILPMGRSEMVTMLYTMKQMPGDDGKQELSSAEFRRALRMANMIPDGLESVDPEEQRIQQMIRQLYGDGKQPGMDVTDRQLHKILRLENHRKAIDLLKLKILSPPFRDPEITSPVVVQAFLDLIDLHGMFLDGDQSSLGGIGMEVEEANGRSMAQSLDVDEQSMYTTNGKMTENGLLMGM